MLNDSQMYVRVFVTHANDFCYIKVSELPSNLLYNKKVIFSSSKLGLLATA